MKELLKLAFRYIRAQMDELYQIVCEVYSWGKMEIKAKRRRRRLRRRSNLSEMGGFDLPAIPECLALRSAAVI